MDFTADPIFDPIFLRLLIANLAFFFFGAVLVDLDFLDGDAFDAFDLEEEEAALVT